MKQALMSLGALAFVICSSMEAQAHCQVPCGIYDDHARIHAMQEDVQTIDKAVKQITALADKTDAQSKNQLVRWTMTKEQHASHIITVISEYFLTQKIKAPTKKNKTEWNAYVARLVACHAVMKAAMKAKQTVAAHSVTALTVAIDSLAALYPTSK